jgi:hypothetical protein
MSTRSRRLALITLALAVAGCGPNATPPPSSAPTEAPASAAPSGSSEDAGQSDSEWGRIWDALPATFPRFPGSSIADATGPEPVSARFAVPDGDAHAIATWMQDALETATFSTEAMNGPFEDGGYVIDSVGEGECRMQTRIAPEGGTTFIEILYGAGCPAPGS